jgi:hypothetical protein
MCLYDQPLTHVRATAWCCKAIQWQKRKNGNKAVKNRLSLPRIELGTFPFLQLWEIEPSQA